LTTVPPTPVGDPCDAVISAPVVAEHKRVCSMCRTLVGQTRDGEAGRTDGFCQSCGTRFDFRPALVPGDLVAGQYQVVGCLAHGGMGWIYLALDRNVSDRPVVLKGLLNSGDADTVAAAIAERQFLAQVGHPLIVGIYNFVTHDGAGYTVMEYVGGKSLKQILAERRDVAGRIDPLPVDQALAYVLEVLPAFTHLHERGLLYCDFKPENLISQGEGVRLIDLGGVRHADDHVSALFGTVGYQAPEVPQDGASVASDVFTIGRTLATLVLDFKGNTTTYATTLPPVRDHLVLSRYDSFYRLLAKACAHDSDDRFASVDELRVQMLGVLREVVATDRGTAARSTAASLAFGPVTVDVAERPVRSVELPALRADEHDRMNAWLDAVTEDDPERRFAALLAAPETTAEVLVAQGQAAIGAAADRRVVGSVDWWSSQVCDTLEQLQDLDPWDWRAAWLAGMAELDRGDTLAARASFNAVYGQVPGELAPKLALAATCEASDELDLAEGLYQVCAFTDASYTSPGAFGLARIRARRGDLDAAVAALDLISPTRSAYLRAQLLRARLLAEAQQVPPVPEDPALVAEALSALVPKAPEESPGAQELPGAQAPAKTPEPTPAPVLRGPRLEGPVDYLSRPPSSVDEVAAVCASIADKDGGWSPTDLVHLSGIAWRVLDVQGGHALLLADQVVGTGRYHTASVDVTWQLCSLRRWLNSAFVGSVGEALASRLVVVELVNEPSPTWETGGGTCTHDRVFVLSAQEAATYLAGVKDVEWSAYRGAKRFGQSPDEQGLAATDEEGQATWWWLRTPGDYRDAAAYVYANGSIFDDGGPVSASGGIRPAMWLDLSAA